MTLAEDVRKNCKFVDKVDSNDIVFCKCGDACCCQWQLENTVFYSCDISTDLRFEAEEEQRQERLKRKANLKIVC